ncbi:MAG: ferrochelatase [SAR86 cluster bacterium]|uniref:Ferrochelatase n=1 Tax=SAR86 cluster bacterium TaxID=2030880 RepID=A0A2A5CAL4_9GAMM|nr:MAG: ferrochelatase [SAR86 cluster bacterium]
MKKRAVLLVNLGSPDAPEVPEVRKYLKQFLMDPYVIHLPWLLRALLVNFLVLPKRPHSSAEAYRSIWTEDGSPLIHYSQELLKALQAKLDIPVAIAMRYGKPSIESQIKSLLANGGSNGDGDGNKKIDEILFIPLYPHHADSTVTTSVKEAERVIRENNFSVKLQTLKPFYDDKSYIDALVNSAASALSENYDHILFSYHGLPELHITKADPTDNHCLKSESCCSVTSASPAHATCYRHQVLRTTECFAQKAGLSSDQYTVAYQSRLGRAQWLEPSTDNTLVKLAQQGKKKILVLCPAFVTDCLETLEEIDIRGRKTFFAAGGEELTYIPCLNDNEDWVDCLSKWIKEYPTAQ